MGYKVLVAFRQNQRNYNVGDDFAANEHGARPLLMQGLIAKKEADAPQEKPKPKAKRRGA